MGSEILRRDDEAALPTSSSDVEFALVLSRMIDSIKNDPRHLRETVYELARRKLQEQFTHENVRDMRPISKALETAIQGVEAFARKTEQAEETQRAQQPALEKPRTLIVDPSPSTIPVIRPKPPLLEGGVPKSRIGLERKNSTLAPLRRLALLLVIIAALAIAVRQSGITLESVRTKANLLIAKVSIQSKIGETPASPVVLAAPQQAPVNALPKLSPLVPTSYGIYVVSDDKLSQLELLPGRAPDIRVAISAAVTTPSRTILPDGHVRFIVYRRDSSIIAADRAEVRVIAKIARATSFDAAGKSIVSNTGDSWVIRNISIPYRTGPTKGDPDMYEVQSETPETALSPGRYALILKGQAYDFTVAGAVTDRKQCLERLEASNGQFYSECQKP